MGVSHRPLVLCALDFVHLETSSWLARGEKEQQ